MEEKKELKVSPALLKYTYRKLLEFLQKNHNFTREGLNRVSLSEILDSIWILTKSIFAWP